MLILGIFFSHFHHRKKTNAIKTLILLLRKKTNENCRKKIRPNSFFLPHYLLLIYMVMMNPLCMNRTQNNLNVILPYPPNNRFQTNKHTHATKIHKESYTSSLGQFLLFFMFLNHHGILIN